MVTTQLAEAPIECGNFLWHAQKRRENVRKRRKTPALRGTQAQWHDSEASYRVVAHPGFPMAARLYTMPLFPT
jgi:hypothetical protein